MTYLIVGAVFLLIGAVFFWLNNNSPLQTPFPMVAFPIGFVLTIVGLVRVLP